MFFKCLYTRKLSDITAQTENNAHFEWFRLRKLIFTKNTNLLLYLSLKYMNIAKKIYRQVIENFNCMHVYEYQNSSMIVTPITSSYV